MTIKIFTSGPLETNTALITCDKTKEAVIVDPAFIGNSPLFDYLEENEIKLTKILLTHSHWDHILGINALQEKFDLPIFVHSEDAAALETPGSDGIPNPGIAKSCKADHFVNDGEIIPVGEVKLEVIHTPGHTAGSVCYYCEESGFLLSGDTLFKGSMGNISFATSIPEKIWASLEGLSKLPPETKVIPGHGEMTSIGEEAWLSNAKAIFG